MPKTSPTRLAPGATPTTRMLQPGGSGCAWLTNCDRSWVTVPWAAIDDASPKASRPSEIALGPAPEKSW